MANAVQTAEVMVVYWKMLEVILGRNKLVAPPRLP